MYKSRVQTQQRRIGIVEIKKNTYIYDEMTNLMGKN